MSSFPDAEKLARVLSERGLRARWAVRVGTHPMRLDGARAALMAMTGLDERKARRALEQRELVIEGVGFEEARAKALELQRAGGYSWVEHAISERFAFGASTRDEPCEWLSLLGRTLILARGRPWNWGPSAILMHEGRSAELGRAIDEQRERWAESGLTEVEREHELLVGISPVHPPFEDALREAPEDELPELATVYADWLQDQGDPRGRLGSAALHESAAAFDQLLAAHDRHLLGPLPEPLWRGLRWVGPLIVDMRLPPKPGPDDTRELALVPERIHTLLDDALLRAPATSQVRRLDLAGAFASIAQSTLAEAPCRASVRELTLRKLVPRRDSPVELPGFPRLERLRLSQVCCGLALGPTPELRRLTVEFGLLQTSLMRCFEGLQAPKLRHLGLGFRDATLVHESAGLFVDQLRDTLALPLFARLRSLRIGVQRRLPLHADFLHMLRTLPCREHLEHIDLRRCLLSPNSQEALTRLRDEVPHAEIQA